jgi:SAM-dependent methyltransferase
MPERSDQNARRYYDDFSNEYERERGYGYHQMIDDLEVQVTAPYARGARVLELGCGTGLILARIADVADEAVGIDLSEGMAQLARDRGLDARIGSVCDLPFEDDEFDLTYSFKVLTSKRRFGRQSGSRGQVGTSYWSSTIRGASAISRRRSPALNRSATTEPRRIFSRNVELVDYHGVRVLTPFAAVHRIPWMTRGLSPAERLAGRSPLRYFGGFLIAVLRKSSSVDTAR